MFNTYRKATDSDFNAVRTSAERFCHRHDIKLFADSNPVLEIDCQIETLRYRYPAKAARLARQWAGCMCRALGVSYTRNIGIAWGQIGVWV